VDSTHNPNIITGGNAKPIDELALDEALGLEKVVIKVREVLDAAGIDWIEPYSLGAESTDYRFIVPKISIFR